MITQLQTDAYKHFRRVVNDSGSIVDNVENRKSIDELVAGSKELIESASLVMVPSGVKSGKLRSLKPTDGSGDFTVARNSVKWVKGKDGLYREVAVNVPGMEWSEAAGKWGVLVEPQATNLLAQSYNFSNAYWSKAGATIDNNGGAGYDCPFLAANNVNLKRAFKLAATSNAGYIRLATALTVTAAQTYTNSIFIKRLTGTGTVSIIDTNGTDRTITVTNDWTRVTYSSVASATTGQIGIKLATSGDEVMICQADVVNAAAVSSPIFTAGATVTRLSDGIATSAISLSPESSTWYAEFSNANQLASGSYGVMQKINNTAYKIGLGLTAGNRRFILLNYENSVETFALTASAIITEFAFTKIAIKATTTSIKLFVNGVMAASLSGSYSINQYNQINYNSVSTAFKMMLFKNAVYSDLTDAECIALTTL